VRQFEQIYMVLSKTLIRSQFRPDISQTAKMLQIVVFLQALMAGRWTKFVTVIYTRPYVVIPV